MSWNLHSFCCAFELAPEGARCNWRECVYFLQWTSSCILLHPPCMSWNLHSFCCVFELAPEGARSGWNECLYLFQWSASCVLVHPSFACWYLHSFRLTWCSSLMSRMLHEDEEMYCTTPRTRLTTSFWSISFAVRHPTI